MSDPVLLGYCVRRAGEPPPSGGPGAEHVSPVFLLEEADLGIWVSEVASIERDPEALRRFDAVNREALRSATPVPLRFGTRFADEEAARNALRARREEFLRIIARVAGSVEMGVRVLSRQAPPPVSEAPPVASGREFLEQRRREILRTSTYRHDAEGVLERIDREFRDVRTDHRRAVSTAPPVLGTLAHLIPRDRLEAYRSCAERAVNAVPEVRLRVSGPWAPYSFV